VLLELSAFNRLYEPPSLETATDIFYSLLAYNFYPKKASKNEPPAQIIGTKAIMYLNAVGLYRPPKSVMMNMMTPLAILSKNE